MSFKDRCWTEIDRSVLRENLRILQSRIPDGCRLMGIVKANGYGHGAAEVAALFADVPGSWLGVACLQEALDLRRAGIALPILILGYTPPHQAAVLAENRLTQALLSPEYTCRLAQEARRQGVRVMAHAAVDTGMGRIGYAACDAAEAARALAADYRRAELEVTGIFTHFSSAYAQTEDARAYTRGQFEKFSAVCGELRRLGVDPGLRHCANSPATVNCPEYAMDLCRVGTVLYGLLPPTAATCPLPLRPALTWKARVAVVRQLPAGVPVSYDRTAVTGRPTRLAVVTAGDADGYFRQLSNLGKVKIRGHVCPVLGRVCMDMFMADITDFPDVQAGDEVVLLGGRGEDAVPCQWLYQPIGIGPSAVTCNIRPRVARTYLGE